MPRKPLLDQIKAIEMARTYCRLTGVDPDEMVADYFTDAAGCKRRVRKER